MKQNDNMNTRGISILFHYKKIIEERTFNEYDVMGFLILIREYIPENKLNDTNKYYMSIKDFADGIAHRKRNKGKIFNSFKEAKDNDYCSYDNSPMIKGVNGFNYNYYLEAWRKIGQYFEINMSDKIIKDIMVCVCSLLQFTIYETSTENDCERFGRLCLLINNDQLDLCIIPHDKAKPFICYLLIENINDYLLDHEYKWNQSVNAPFTTIRKNGQLKLVL